MNNEQFLKDRQAIRDMLFRKDGVSGNMVASVPLTEPLFVKQETRIYQIVGVNSSFVNNEYVEIFIAVDISDTMFHFDGNAVKSFYFNLDTIQKTNVITQDEAKKDYKRPDWRRVQKYIKKELKNIIKPKENINEEQ